jgi:hypothetical protein
MSDDKRPPDVVYKHFASLAPELQAAVRRGVGNTPPPEIRPIIYDTPSTGVVRAVYMSFGAPALYTKEHLTIVLELLISSVEELAKDEDAAVKKLPKLCLNCFTLGCDGACK